ncbi:MAG: PEP-CTERM sorting domain-containing protein [Phycisphaeraceae bacterium]
MSRIVLSTSVLAIVALALAPPALADWQEQDGHKMHFPQLPDPNGWDVDVTNNWMYDDWQCGGTGRVDDVHLWVSWQGGLVGQINRVHLEIWSDVPAGADTQVPFSHPGGVLWQGEFLPGKFIVGPPLAGVQGWYSPEAPTFVQEDHLQYFQLNIAGITAPFVQQIDTTYWLGVHIIPETAAVGPQPIVGWKTSLNHFNDDAAFFAAGQWHELLDPVQVLPPVSLDMAFVITPEPASLVLLTVGGLMLLRRR